MKRFKELNKKSKIIIIFLLILITGIGTSLAIFMPRISNRATSNTNIISDKLDNLEFLNNKPNGFNIKITQFSLAEGGNNLSDSVTATAKLTANSTTNSASYNYYVYLDITNNNFVYTTSPTNTPEILMTVQKPDNTMAVAADLPNLTYSTVKGISGFDLTTKEGLITIVDNYPITSNSSTNATVQNWVITLYFINLDTNQYANAGKTLNAQVIIQKDRIFCGNGTALANCITSQPLVTSEAGLYHHKNLTNSAEDDSYRYAGASTSVKNYVCFGSTASPCPETNLYRIIGAFKNASNNYEVKLIKADFAGETELGAVPATSQAMPSTSYPNYNTTHGGYLTSVPRYYWHTSQVNNWVNTSGNPAASLNILLNSTDTGKYLANLGTEWTNKITTHTWKVAGNDWALIGTQNAPTAYANEITTPKSDYTPQTAQAKIGLMYVSDYGFSATPNNWATNLNAYNNTTNTDNNWLYMGMTEWTITRRADYTSRAFGVGNTGIVNSNNVTDILGGVRPVFYLESQATYSSGDGSRNNPIRLG